jgi:trimeric autotransporter adhesin
MANSWGAADTGGAYTLAGTTANFDVNGAEGTISTAANATMSAYLTSVSALNVDITFRVRTDKLAVGGSHMAYFVARRVSNGNEYLGRLRLSTDGSVRLQAVQDINGAATLLGNEKVVSGVTHTANSYFWVRGQVVGTNPTTIRLKAWADDQPEPTTWLYSITDTAASIQASGGVGLRTYLSSSATNAPVLFTFDDLLVTSVSGS